MPDIGFWTTLTKKKIEVYKLDAEPKFLQTKFRLGNKPEKISTLSINAYSFGDTLEEIQSGAVEYFVNGTFTNFNTIEEFQKVSAEEEESNNSFICS
jgi:hypothetical protein